MTPVTSTVSNFGDHVPAVAQSRGKRYQCGGNATGTFKRSEFGMKYGLPAALGDEVKLWMSFYGFRDQRLLSNAIAIGDLTVNRLGLGAMRVIDNDDIWGEPKDRANSLKVLRRAVELGVNFFDTAESYGPQTNETLIAEALYPYPKGFVVATKCGLARPSPDRWDADCRPAKLRQDLEGSLKRLRLERIDLYQLHTVDPKVPLEVSVGALADMQREGKVRHIGLSNVTVKQLERARGIAPIVSVQNRYSFADRGSESVLQHCEKNGIAFLPWYPLGDGSALRLSKVKKLSERLKASPAQVAIAWLLKKSPVMLPIPGTGNLAHLEENVAAATLQLSREDFAELG